MQNYSSVQGYDESYNVEDSYIIEEEDVKVDDGITDRKFIVFESQLITLFHRYHICGLEVKLETSIVGKWLMS